MAYVQPLRALRYDPVHAGPLDDLIAPPYDVIDDELRAALAPGQLRAGRRHPRRLA